MAYDAHKNLAVSTVATAPSPATSGTTLVVASGEGARFPAPPFQLIVRPATGASTPLNTEVTRVTNVTGDTLTVIRAQEDSTARTIVAGDIVFSGPTAKSFTDIENQVDSKAALAHTHAAYALGSAGVTIDGGGSPITTGFAGYAVVPFSGTITGWTLVARPAGTLAVDVRKVALAGGGFPPGPANSIVGATPPTLSAQEWAVGSPVGWTGAVVSANDALAFQVTAAGTSTWAKLGINISKA